MTGRGQDEEQRHGFGLFLSSIPSISFYSSINGIILIVFLFGTWDQDFGFELGLASQAVSCMQPFLLPPRACLLLGAMHALHRGLIQHMAGQVACVCHEKGILPLKKNFGHFDFWQAARFVCVIILYIMQWNFLCSEEKASPSPSFLLSPLSSIS